jgi:hypothetical protein
MPNPLHGTHPGIEIAESSGILRVTMRPRARWYFLPLVLAVELAVFVMLKDVWIAASLWLRLLIVAFAASSLAAIGSEFFVTHVIEFSAEDLTVRNDFHGWERRQVYRMNECSQMEWEPGRAKSHTCGLKCKVGWQTIRFAKGISEEESIEIFVALDKYLPDVAKRICANQKDGDHFIRLGLKSWK